MPPATPDTADLELLATAYPPAWREPPIGWAAVEDFESTHGIILPEPYRTLIAEITNGSGRGPSDQGLLGLDEIPSGWWGDPDERDPAAGFPLNAKRVWHDDDDDLAYDASHHGSILLGAEDDGSCWHLIVTGPRRGRVWLIGEVGAYEFGSDFVYSRAGQGFAGWIAYWLTGAGWFDELPPSSHATATAFDTDPA